MMVRMTKKNLAQKMAFSYGFCETSIVFPIKVSPVICRLVGRGHGVMVEVLHNISKMVILSVVRSQLET